MMLTLLFVVGTLDWAAVAPTAVEVCRATVFGHHGDRYAGGRSRALGRHVRPADRGYAHRTHPDWTLAVICTTSRCTTARKIDTGPFGADHEGGWRLKRRRMEPGTWRGCVDLTPPVARELGATRVRSWSRRVLVVAWPTRRRWRERWRFVVVRGWLVLAGLVRGYWRRDCHTSSPVVPHTVQGPGHNAPSSQRRTWPQQPAFGPRPPVGESPRRRRVRLVPRPQPPGLAGDHHCDRDAARALAHPSERPWWPRAERGPRGQLRHRKGSRTPRQCAASTCVPAIPLCARRRRPQVSVSTRGSARQRVAVVGRPCGDGSGIGAGLQ